MLANTVRTVITQSHSVPLDRAMQYVKVAQRGFFTSITSKAEEIKKIVQDPVTRRNLFFAADLQHLGSVQEIVGQLNKEGIPDQQIVPIIAADGKPHTTGEIDAIGIFLQRKFSGVLIIKGSTRHAMEVTPAKSQYPVITKLVKQSGNPLGLVISPNQSELAFLRELEQKRRNDPAALYTQPMPSIKQIPAVNRRELGKLLADKDIQLTQGILATTKRMYETQRMESPLDLRVDFGSGRDKYLFADRLDGEKDWDYFMRMYPDLDQFVNAHRHPSKNPGLDYYTRSGLSHEEGYKLIVKMWAATERDLQLPDLLADVEREKPNSDEDRPDKKKVA